MIDRLVGNILEWAAGHADEGRFSPVAIVFHWTMSALIFFQLFWGWWASRLPVGGGKVAAYDLHFAVGVLMLVMALGRIGWRLFAPAPINDADKPGWTTEAAHITQLIFYGALIGLPLSGWAMISATARDQNLTFLGLFPWPLMPLDALSNPMLWRIEEAAEWIHWAFIVSLLLLIPVHVGAALKHHFIDRDDVLHGMLPVVAQLPPKRTRAQVVLRQGERAIGSLARRLWTRFRLR